MKILFLGPFPPPVSGQSLAVKIFKESINEPNCVEIVNLNKNSFKSGWSFRRFFEVLGIFYKIYKAKNHSDKIYFTISESIAGNLKDIIIYILCYNKLHETTIHLHGGGSMRVIMSKNNVLTSINKFFLKRLENIIVLGKSHEDIYSSFIMPKKLFIVPNFAEDYIFLDREKIKIKFTSLNPVNILFLSNLIPGKGYLELLDAFAQLNSVTKDNVRIDFAGGFESESDKKVFLDRIKGISQIGYRGVVGGQIKMELFHKAHVFCLPAYYPEGQPISILEAYASGCTVVTTNDRGIGDIFVNGVNGIEVKKNQSNH
jgi:glycosyltransferase involved in cell wall biosynthesis